MASINQIYVLANGAIHILVLMLLSGDKHWLITFNAINLHHRERLEKFTCVCYLSVRLIFIGENVPCFLLMRMF